MVTGEDSTQAWLLLENHYPCTLGVTGLARDQGSMPFLLLLPNMSKGQIGEKLKVLLLVRGTSFCFIVHHGLSFRHFRTYPIP